MTGWVPYRLNRNPIWKRHILPLTPITSEDPYDLPVSPSPPLKRLKSKTKIGGSNMLEQPMPEIPSALQSNHCAILSESSRTSPRKKNNLSKGGLSAVFLPTVKSRLVSSSSNHRSIQMPVMIRPHNQDFIHTSNTPVKELSHSRSSVNLHLSHKIPSVRTSPRKKLHLNSSVSDLHGSTTEENRKKRRSSLTEPGKIVTAPLRRSISAESGGNEVRSHIPKKDQVGVLPSTTVTYTAKLCHSRSKVNLQPVFKMEKCQQKVTAIRTSPRRKLYSTGSVGNLRSLALTDHVKEWCVSPSESGQVVTALPRSISVESREVQQSVPMERRVADQICPLRTSPRRKYQGGTTTNFRVTPQAMRRSNTCISLLDCHKQTETHRLYKTTNPHEIDINSVLLNPASVPCIINSHVSSSSKATGVMNGEETDKVTISPVLESFVLASSSHQNGDPSCSEKKSYIDSFFSMHHTSSSQECCTSVDVVNTTTCFCTVEACSSRNTCASKKSESSIIEEKDRSASSTSLLINAQNLGNKRVRFEAVNVYYFARSQGISTVPKSGEVSLGMMDKHFTKRQFPLLFDGRPELTLTNGERESISESHSEEPCGISNFEGYHRPTTCQLQLYEGKTRIKMLKRSGVNVRKEESVESLESIRKSRALCGCQCENGVCLSELCQCAKEGIVCQVDGPDGFGKTHPCWCSRMTCSNPHGRVEFDPENVKNHYRITMMRLKDAEKSGIYNSPQHIRFNSDGEPEFCHSITPSKPSSYTSTASCTFVQPSGTISSPTTSFLISDNHKRDAKVEHGENFSMEMAISK